MGWHFVTTLSKKYLQIILKFKNRIAITKNGPAVLAAGPFV
jgi:hypothetical protein